LAIHHIDWLQFPYLAVNPIETKPMDTQQIRVAIVDDNSRFRKQLGKLLEKEPDICVVAEAETGPAGIKEVEEHKPDVILMDKNNPFTEGLDTTSMIVSTFPDTRIIVLSLQSENSMTASKCQTFACYSMCENCSTEEILAAIRENYRPA
jgi:DNA-binding NarL/FixJ family response regulator